MNARAITDAIEKEGLWKTDGGKTPWNSFYAHARIEIDKKGKSACFKFLGKGLFAANPAYVKE